MIRASQVYSPAVADQPHRLFGKLHGMDVIEDHLGVEARGVLLEARHQVRPLNAVGISRPVVDLGGGHQLSALGHAGDQHRIEVGASGIHGCRIAGWAGT
jgi:hypothetical protein